MEEEKVKVNMKEEEDQEEEEEENVKVNTKERIEGGEGRGGESEYEGGEVSEPSSDRPDNLVIETFLTFDLLGMDGKIQTETSCVFSGVPSLARITL
ncbi:hypothetical protein M8J77_004834 [Diaphorina citri]|nr:hypothetical protein M8J77_004834 [Diaphorina citri]